MEEAKEEVDAAEKVKKERDPVRLWTFIILGLCAVLVVWYIRADRVTPFTSQARVNSVVVPIASQVSGTVTSVGVKNNQRVKAGQVLFAINKSSYEFAVQLAQAQFESAEQSTAAAASAVDAAEARVITSGANLVRAQQDADRMHAIRKKDKGAISVRRLQMADASLASAKGAVAGAKAQLQQAIDNYGSDGERNFRILQAKANLDKAKYDLSQTIIYAPDDGLVTGVRLDKGNFAAVGAPQMTFIATHNYWIQADFTENNLGKMKPGMKVEMVFDVMPGKVYEGTVREMGYGVAVDSAPLGALPTIENKRSWLRDAQRFPVLIDIVPVPAEVKGVVKVGSQVSVSVYTGDHIFWNPLAWLYIRLVSILSYAY